MKTKISIILIDGSFREKFHSLKFFADQTFPKDSFELIWVEYYDKVDAKLEKEISGHSNFKIIKLNRNGVYHSSYCFNEAIRRSSGELILIPDADVVVEKDFVERVYKEHKKNENLVMYIYRYNEPEDLQSDVIDLDHLRKTCVLTNPNNYGGCLTVRKKWLLEINGYEQHPVFSGGFHANGYDVYTRFKSLGLQVKWHPELKLYHPWHPLTLVKANSFDLQKTVSDYRAKKLIYRTAEGIDPELNVPLDSELAKLINSERSGKRLYSKIKNMVRLFP